MNKDEIIQIGLQKVNNEIDLTWNDIGEMFGLEGEKVRDWVKKYRYKHGLVNGKHDPSKTKILHISDSHYPFHLPIESFSKYVGKVDILVLNGDILDAFQISRFIKKYRLSFMEELIGGRQYIIDLINYIKPKTVYLNYGNHCARMLKYFGEKVHEDMLTLLPETALDFIVDLGFYHHDHQNKSRTFYEPLKNVFDNIDVIYTKNWYNRIGNTIFAHPSAYKSSTLKTSEDAYLYFLQIGEQNIDCICLAHTHQWGLTKRGNVFLIESGCCCKPQDYANGKLYKPQVQGYAYIVQDKDGNFLYDESKLELT